MKASKSMIFATVKSQYNKASFYLPLLLCIANAIFGIIVAAKESYFGGWIAIENNLNFHAFFLIIVFISIMIQKRQEEENIGLHLYYKNKKKYFQTHIKEIALSTLFLFLIQRLFLLIGLNLFNSSSLGIGNFEVYSISNLLYLAMIVIRNLSYFVIISIILYQLMSIVSESYSIIFLILLVAYLLNNRVFIKTTQIIDSVFEIPISLRQQLTFNHYSNFLFEISASFMYGLFLCWIAYLLYLYKIKRRGVI